MVTPDTVDHLSEVCLGEMDIFATAMRGAGLRADAAVDYGVEGARRMSEVIARVNA